MNTKKIALIAHDNKKAGLLEWVKFNKGTLLKHDLFATGTTGKIIEEELCCKITKLQSGPLGGDQQIGARIAEGTIGFLIFFWDPLSSLSHDPDIKALLRIASVWNIPIACNRSSADFLIFSPLMSQEYQRTLSKYEPCKNRYSKKNCSTPLICIYPHRKRDRSLFSQYTLYLYEYVLKKNRNIV